MRRCVLEEDVAVLYVVASLQGPGRWQDAVDELYESPLPEVVSDALDQYAHEITRNPSAQEWQEVVTQALRRLDFGQLRASSVFEREFPLAHSLWQELRGRSSSRSAGPAEHFDLFLRAQHPRADLLVATETKSASAALQAWKHKHPVESKNNVQLPETMKILRAISTYSSAKPVNLRTQRQTRRRPSSHKRERRFE